MVQVENDVVDGGRARFGFVDSNRWRCRFESLCKQIRFREAWCSTEQRSHFSSVKIFVDSIDIGDCGGGRNGVETRCGVE